MIAWLFAIPAAIVAAVLMLLAEIVTVLAFFAIMITGEYPESMFEFVTRVAVRMPTDGKQGVYQLVSRRSHAGHRRATP